MIRNNVWYLITSPFLIRTSSMFNLWIQSSQILLEVKGQSHRVMRFMIDKVRTGVHVPVATFSLTVFDLPTHNTLHVFLSPFWKESLGFHWSIACLYVTVSPWSGGRHLFPYLPSVARGQGQITQRFVLQRLTAREIPKLGHVTWNRTPRLTTLITNNAVILCVF